MTDLTGISEPARLAYAAGITPLDYAEHEIAVLLDAHATAAAFCARNGYAPVVDTSPAVVSRRVIGWFLAAGWEVPGGIEIPGEVTP
jgi:hypothetical protein